MPHRCTDCGRAFADGSKEMLSGCPDCGGTTFQYLPEGDGADAPDAEPPDPPDAGPDSSVARTVGSAATAVRDMVSPDPDPPDPGSPDAPDGPGPDPADPADPSPPAPDGEDTAQADARSQVVSDDELPAGPVGAGGAPAADTGDAGDAELDAGPGSDPREQPDLEDLRAELNDQFESIRVVEPGQYELNLMGLYDREAYIIALQEDGKYTIQVPERWKE